MAMQSSLQILLEEVSSSSDLKQDQQKAKESYIFFFSLFLFPTSVYLCFLDWACFCHVCQSHVLGSRFCVSAKHTRKSWYSPRALTSYSTLLNCIPLFLIRLTNPNKSSPSPAILPLLKSCQALPRLYFQRAAETTHHQLHLQEARLSIPKTAVILTYLMGFLQNLIYLWTYWIYFIYGSPYRPSSFYVFL